MAWMKQAPLAWTGAAVLVAVVVLSAVLAQREEEPAPSASSEPNLFPFVRSLQGTSPDGNIQATAGDELVVNAELVQLFDYYLAAVGEQPLDAIRAEIERELDKRLKPGAAGEAKRLLARYLDYKRALVEVEKNSQVAGGTVDAIRSRLATMQQVRSRFFSAGENQALFGLDDAYDLEALARIEISQDKSLSDAQKQEKLAALDAALPSALREARHAPLKIVRLEEAAQKMRAEGASEDDIYRMRAATVSPEAAARLAEVDRENKAWSNRIASYLAERNNLIVRNAHFSDVEREAALQQLRDAHFDVDEQKRLPAYE